MGTTKGLQDFQIEKNKHMNQMKEKILQDYERKRKQVETSHAIARSSAINKSRLKKIKSRQEMIGKIAEDTKGFLLKELTSEAKAKPFVTNLIVQGLLMVPLVLVVLYSPVPRATSRLTTRSMHGLHLYLNRQSQQSERCCSQSESRDTLII